ncbi:hypothetical protein OGAPHI_003969 [Ogataea philodendri]|uniref:Uncharacterized protein n=1 Tax=Ogataea philodendri TaxID=1378263 RepID=A0A9P8T5C9_9ASCO|nr:uncharacterized protein OGAPHI_003969 [Ogataea philodendri]KAH3665781.1 hypothetical protein OGAPHI_003969 [Ogataea philodendri]
MESGCLVGFGLANGVGKVTDEGGWNAASEVGVLAPCSDLGSVEEESKWNSTAGQSDESHQGGCPLVSQTVVHLNCEQWHCGSPNRSDEGLSSQCRGGIVLIRVDNVVVGGVVKDVETKSTSESGKTWSSPRQSWVGRPGKGEQSSRNEPATNHHWEQTQLCRWNNSLVSVNVGSSVIVVVHPWRDGHSCKHTNSNRNEHQTSLGVRPALTLGIHNWVTEEEHVNSNFEFGQSSVFFITGSFSQLLSSVFEDFVVRGFRHQDDKGSVDSSTEDQDDPVNPSPSNVITDVATDQRTKSRTNERSSRENSHGKTSFFDLEQVCKTTTNQTHWSREGQTVDQSANKQGANVLGKSARNNKHNSNEQSRKVDNGTAELFRQWSKRQRAETKSKHKQRHGQNDNFLGDVEAFHRTSNITSHRGGSKCDSKTNCTQKNGEEPSVAETPVLRVLLVSVHKHHQSHLRFFVNRVFPLVVFMEVGCRVWDEAGDRFFVVERLLKRSQSTVSFFVRVHDLGHGRRPVGDHAFQGLAVLFFVHIVAVGELSHNATHARGSTANSILSRRVDACWLGFWILGSTIE